MPIVVRRPAVRDYGLALGRGVGGAGGRVGCDVDAGSDVNVKPGKAPLGAIFRSACSQGCLQDETACFNGCGGEHSCNVNCSNDYYCCLQSCDPNGPQCP